MAYKSKFLHFKTKASYNAERAKTTAGTEERKVFDAYISFIDEGPMICTWGKEYKCDISASEVEALVNAGKISPATVAPLIAGTAAVGTSTKYAREDHRHPAQTTVSGNAGTATKLATPRVIAIAGAVSGSATFDGSSNVSINSTLNGFDASKITSGTISEARLPNIPIEKLPAGALERMFVVESQTAAIDAVKAGTIQEGDVVQIGNGGLMYFCIDDAATTFGNAFKEFTAGSATSVPWSGVTGKPTFATVATSGSYNDLSNKPTIPSLSGYATQSWVTSQGYSTKNTWRPVKVGSTTLNDSSTTLTIANGTGIGLSFSNGTLTITNSAPGSSYTLPVAKNNVLGGIKTGYTESGGAEMAIYVLEDGTAYTLLKDTTVKTALGFTPANVNDIPEIPIALPNPYALNVIAGSSTTSYTGSSASTINLDNIFSKQLPILTNADDAGKPGIYFTNSTTQVNVIARVTKEQPDAIVVVPSATPVVFDEPTVFLMDGIYSLSGGTYKCYCITWIAAAQSGLREDLILVNGAIYG